MEQFWVDCGGPTETLIHRMGIVENLTDLFVVGFRFLLVPRTRAQHGTILSRHSLTDLVVAGFRFLLVPRNGAQHVAMDFGIGAIRIWTDDG